VVGIPEHFLLYSARHTFGTDIIERTGNIKLVQEVMGDESVTTTQRYLHADKSNMGDHINQRNCPGRLALEAEKSGHTAKIVQ
jgi:site-specific recombinase XerD